MGASNALATVKHCAQHGAYDAFRLTTLPSGREVFTECPQCRALREEREAIEQRARDASERQQRLEAKLKRAGIPARFRAKTFDGYHATTEGQRHALNVARSFAGEFARHREAGTTLVLSGSPGTGKSHLACAIAQAVIRQGWTALYATAHDLVLMLREPWGSRRDGRTELDVLRDLKAFDLLVIDEVGVGFGSDAERVQFFTIIDGRYCEQTPTIILTNLDHKRLREFVGQRAFDRLREGGIWVPCAWESYRGQVQEPGTLRTARVNSEPSE